MKKCIASLSIVLSLLLCGAAAAQVTSKVVDIPTREGVTQRFVYLAPDKPRKAVILFSGGNGGLQITPDGVFAGGDGNFLVRTRALFASRGLAVAVVDAPSDRQQPPFLSGFRMTPQHATDIKAVIAWLKQSGLPVWLVGTSRGTQSAAYVATQLAADGGPDGLVLTSTVLNDNRSLPVPGLPVDKLTIPVLVVHHEQDVCKVCAYSDVPLLMERLAPVAVKELMTFTGGITRGDPCQPKAYHGYNGIEADVVAKIADWIDAH
jgi:hypothetical protein